MQTAELPLVSIIVPVYNSEKFLNSCIQSLVKQSYKNIEIIIINDGSTDQSKNLCDFYSKSDHRITVIHKNNNEGVTQARLSGFTHSKGDFITFVDSDDYIHLQFVEIMVNTALCYNADMVGCQYFHVVNKNIYKTAKRPKEGVYNEQDIRQFLMTNFLFDDVTGKAGTNPFLWTKLIKRPFVSETLKVGKELWYEEDLVGTLKLLQTIKTMVILPDYLYYYSQHNNQVTKQFNPKLWKNSNNCWTIIKELDRDSFFVTQFPKRVILTVYDILKKCSSERYSFFKAYFQMMRNSEVVNQALDLKCDNSINLKSKLKIYILKGNLTLLLYILFKGQTKINNVLRL